MLEKEAVNRYLLAISHLLPETRPDSVGAVLRDLAVLDANNLEDAYFSLYLRVRSFNVQAFEKGLYRGPTMARVKGLKNYMQIIPQEYLPAVYTVSKSDREASARNLLDTWGIADDEYRKVGSKILESLDGKEKTLIQLKKSLAPVSREIIRKRKEKAMNVSIVAQAMMDRWILLRGGIGRQPGENPGRFSVFKERFRMKLDMDRDKAISSLAKLYFRVYGPASAEDLAWWMGVTLNEALAAIGRLEDKTAVKIDGVQGHFYMPEKEEGDISEKIGGHVILLPKDDPYVKAYKNVERLVPAEKSIMTKFGESASVVLINGAVWGTWHMEKDRLTDICSVEMFDGHPAIEGLKGKLEHAATEAGRFYTGGPVEVIIEPD